MFLPSWHLAQKNNTLKTVLKISKISSDSMGETVDDSEDSETVNTRVENRLISSLTKALTRKEKNKSKNTVVQSDRGEMNRGREIYTLEELS